MSTRGCVAIRRNDGGWIGVYNHSDSYPTGLGAEVWDHVQALRKRGKTLRQFAEELLKYDDWQNYLNGGVCPYCGRRGQGQPHSISSNIWLTKNTSMKEMDPERLPHICSSRSSTCPAGFRSPTSPHCRSSSSLRS